MKVGAMLAVVPLLLLSLASTAHAVDEGVPDGDRHPNVGQLGYDLDGDGPEPAGFWCSGSVLSERHFLTAAHCITARPPDVEWVVTLQAGTPGSPVVEPGVFPESFAFAFTGPATRGGVATIHPDFDPDRLAHDVAVVTFPAGSFAGVAPVEIADIGLLERLRRLPSLRLVGYGMDPERGNGAPVFVVEGYRQTRTTSATKITNRQLFFQAGLCLGDSGSPQLLGERSVAVSLLSDVGADCAGSFVSQRLDTRSERRFLAGFVRLS